MVLGLATLNNVQVMTPSHGATKHPQCDGIGGVFCALCARSHKVCPGPCPICIVVPSTRNNNLVMHLYELHACFALISIALVCVVLQPFV